MRTPAFLTPLIAEEIIGSKYARLVEPFAYSSSVLDRVVTVPVGFICDYESVPVFKASSKRAGVLHDYFCRIDSVPVVTKQTAADIYQEAQDLRDSLMGYGWAMRGWRAVLRFGKTSVVRIAWGYFHRYHVLASFEEVSGGQWCNR